ncbi:MobF family relaxase [Jatrophihabitans endophyticus]|uniref:MobF family relaxase n=1 Tax=Jatrophihabitans endophyticus TaxID=1206085 RepID=UPI0019E2191B|nr:MobF family relaxase [Jatrophihabitans endophyticus]MBE7188195.1 relaxase domain-containing protein [Jatrophihabitans endophyticus]
MGLHKLAAGSGYTYLTRQVAAGDDTNRGYSSLGAYYEQKGESPGVWLGNGIASLPVSDGAVFELPVFEAGGRVHERQMIALFGEGRHPDAHIIERDLAAQGVRGRRFQRATLLGREFRTYEGTSDFQQRLADLYREHNEAHDRPVNAAIDPAIRAGLRSKLAREMFAEQHGRAPSDEREMSGFLARSSRPQAATVAGYDLTFSPVKSVSALWAIAPREVSELIAETHHDAVADTISWLEKHACYTRRGNGGPAQVETTGFIAAAFTHRDSRAGDPDLHTHVAVSNKVCTLDGTWLALDGRALFKNKVAASERYNTRLEALLSERLGVRFADRGAVEGKRSVREIVGLDPALLRAWSSRRADIEPALATLRTQFQADHGRPPTSVEAQELAQQATLVTREGKHAPRALAEQRATWRADAATVLGSADAVDRAVRDTLTPAARPARRPLDVAGLAKAVLATLEHERATWQINHVRAETERQVRRGDAVPDFRADELDHLVDAVVKQVLSPTVSVPLTARLGVDESAILRRSDGTSVYEIAGSARYSSPAILNAEHAALSFAARHDGRRVSASTVSLALLESAANGLRLGDDQAALVRDLACSGARVQLALAPAGTGKTVAMRALAHAWTADGGTVIGLAPSAGAAQILRTELADHALAADTLAKLVDAVTTGHAVPDWATRIGPGSLVIIDEAGMAGTLDLATAITHVVDRGGSVRLVGDNRQLAAIGAGGLLRDIERTHGATTLDTVRRFTHPDGRPNHGEAAASLALRDGDPAALAYYADHGRIHVGDATTTADQAYGAWAADRTAGRDSVLLAPTRDQVRELNLRARHDRLAASDEAVGREVTLGDGTTASVGDTIVTRHNDRRLATSATDWVTNGARWKVIRVLPDGSLDVSHASASRRAVLPADYVAEHVQLGYAATIHAAQGMTADTGHVLATGAESRELLYVGLTRGRLASHVYLDVTTGSELDDLTRADAVRPSTAIEMLTATLEHEDAVTSATSEQHAANDPAMLLGKQVAQYLDALEVAAESFLGADNLARLTARAEQLVPGVVDCDAWPALRSQLVMIGLDGTNPYAALQRARDQQSLVGTDDVAAVLAWRLHPEQRPGTGPVPALPAVPRGLDADDYWHRYFDRRHELIDRHAGNLRDQVAQWTSATAPTWAAPLVARDRDLTADLAVWRAGHNIPDSEQRPSGVRRPDYAGWKAQRQLDRRIDAVLGSADSATARWKGWADTIDRRISNDPTWPRTAAALNAAEHAGMSRSALTQLAAQRPLPDEQPAAALRWRVDGAAAEADGSLPSAPSKPHARPRPTWTPTPTGPPAPTIDYARAFGNRPSEPPRRGR